ncbi:degenerate transposase [Streptococcus pneumoniae]|nr:degenerate transposase [Streptococcus pneumoniae]
MSIVTIYENFAIVMELLMPIQALIAGRCNTEWMNAFLEELSQAYPDDYLLLVMDNAIWHKSSTLKIPTNIGFTFIPPYTPEMNPLNKC